MTRTFSPSRTPTATTTPTWTPTPTCAGEVYWELENETQIAQQQGGSLWLTKTVATNTGWGIFWTRQDPVAPNSARVYYAHVGFDGQINVAPLLLQVGITRLNSRGRYYNVAWNVDHYGLIISDYAALYYYSLSIDGVLGNRKSVPITLFTNTSYSTEADSDLEAFPDGFVGVIEGDCSGHSCSYAFKVNLNGDSSGGVKNLVDFDYTHQFWPRVAYDGIGFATISVKDINVSGGGVMTKYIPYTWGSPSQHAKVVPTKEYQWDEFPEIAWNGDHFGAIWTEVSQRVNGAPWQTHFGSFKRTMTTSSSIGHRVLDVRGDKSQLIWTKQIHAVGGGWTAHYSAWQGQNVEPLAVFEHIDDAGNTHERMTPFTLSANALGSSVQKNGPHAGRIGIARGDNRNGVSTVTFFTLDPPVCQ